MGLSTSSRKQLCPRGAAPDRRSCEEKRFVAYHPPQQRTWPISIFAVLRLQSFQPAEDAREPNLVRPSEQPLGVIYPLGHGEIDVGGRGDAHEDGVSGLVD